MDGKLCSFLRVIIYVHSPKRKVGIEKEMKVFVNKAVSEEDKRATNHRQEMVYK